MSEAMACAMESQNRKKIVSDFFGLVTQGRQKDGLVFFAPDCRQHNPYTEGGMVELFEGMAAAQKDMGDYPEPSFVVKSVLADGDMVAAHTELLRSKSKPEEGGLRQVHLFRFSKDNKIVEYWDITQVISPEMGNSRGAF